MSEISFQKSSRAEPGIWPIAASFKGKQLFFPLDFRPEALKAYIAKFQAGRFLDILFLCFGILGLGIFVLHIASPVGDLWLRFFLVTLIADCIYWTRLVSTRQKKADENNLDLTDLFSPEALNHFHKSLLARGDKKGEPVYLLLELLLDVKVQQIFYRLGIGYRQLAENLLPLLSHAEAPPPAISEDLSQIPFMAYEAMVDLGAEKINPAVLLVAISRLPEESKTSQVFAELALAPKMVFQAVHWRVTLDKIIASRAREYGFIKMRPKSEINRSLTSVPTPVLDNFGVDLTLRARFGRLPVVVAREADMEKIFAAVNGGRRGILLVGEHGVGKTSLIDSLAVAMAAEKVPNSISDRRLVLLESGQIIGQGERAGQALTAAVNDAARGGNIVLAVDNIHEFFQSHASGVSLGSILISALQETNIFLIATTTPRDFENVSALANSFFERIDVLQVTKEDAILIASIHASMLEARFNVFWTIEGVEKAVELSERYIQGSNQPQKTIKVLEILSERLGGSKEIAVVGAHEVENIISEIAHVEAGAVGEAEEDKLLNLENLLGQRVIGQEEAVAAVANTMRRIKANLTVGQKRPLGSFLFVGPTGVGKTELAKALAAIEFGSEEHIIRLDMSEFSLPQSTEKLLGGLSYTSSFAAQVRERPYSVILLDEFEKASPEIHNLFLQVLDEGHLTDTAGGKIDLTSSLIIATSNAAWKEIQESFKMNLTGPEFDRKLSHEILVKYFRPELINRFDGVILFKPLATSDVAEIVKLQLGKLSQKLQLQGISLRATPEGIAKIAENAFDSDFGARRLKRYLQDNIESQIATWILSHDLVRRDNVLIAEDGSPQIEKASSV